MNLTRTEMLQRFEDFPREIIRLRNTSTVVHKIVEAYAYCAIATKEEAYCQMIIELAKTRDELLTRVVDEARMKTALSFSLPSSNL